MASTTDSGIELTKLKAERWSSGKVAVSAIKSIALKEGKQAKVHKKGGQFRWLVCSCAPECGWFVKLARYRSKQSPGDWHVTVADLQHRNCTSIAHPTQTQVAEHPVVRAAITADFSASAQSLVTQLRHQAGIGCSTSMIYRAKQQIHAEVFSEDPMTIGLLPSFLSDFQRLNHGTFTEIQRYESGHFKRAIVILDPIMFASSQCLYGVDAAHMEHRKYNGVQIVMVGRDGNFNNRVAAVALAPVEDYDNYLWFFSRITSHGFPLTAVPVFTDHHKGIISATTELGIFNMFCVRHIIGNMRSDKAVRLQVSQDTFVWAANASTTEAEFNLSIQKLADVNTAAAQYLNDIPVTKWTLYTHYRTTRFYGWRTTNFVESEQARSLKLKPRHMLPYEYFVAYANILMKEAYDRHKYVEAWEKKHRVLTPQAERKLQHQIQEAAAYTVNFSSDSVAFVSRLSSPLKQRQVTVSIDGPICSCSNWVQLGITCRHISAIIQTGRLPQSLSAISMMAHCYRVERYKQGQRPLLIPEQASLQRDNDLMPAQIQPQAGRPRKRRIRSRGEVGRVRKLYRCGKCGKADGHNSASCRWVK